MFCFPFAPPRFYMSLMYSLCESLHLLMLCNRSSWTRASCRRYGSARFGLGKHFWYWSWSRCYYQWPGGYCEFETLFFDFRLEAPSFAFYLNSRIVTRVSILENTIMFQMAVLIGMKWSKTPIKWGNSKQNISFDCILNTCSHIFKASYTVCLGIHGPRRKVQQERTNSKH